MVVDEENSALPIDAAIGSVDQVVGRMMGVGSAKALQQHDANVGHIVAVGILQKQEIRS